MFAARSRATSGTVLTVLLGVLVGIVIARPGGSGDFDGLITGPIRFGVALLLAAVVLTSMHEAAHAIVGRLTGWQVFGVTIGHGRRLVTLPLGSFRLELRGTLIGGVTIANPTGHRWRDVAMLGAGITVEMFVIAAVLMWNPTSSWGQHAKWAIVVVACVDIVANLWPRQVDVGQMTGLTTDGAQLVNVLTTPDQWQRDLEQMRLTPSRARLVQTLYGGELEAALDLARAESAAHPTDERAAWFEGTLLLLAGRWRESFDRLAAHAGAPDADPMLANNAAWAAVMTFDPALLPHADRYSEQALQGRSTEPACINTRGATLVLLGRTNEALPLLQLAGTGRLSRKQKAYVLAFTALAEHRTGSYDQSKEHLAASETLDRECPALPEIRRLMAEPAAIGQPTTPAPWPPPRPEDQLSG